MSRRRLAVMLAALVAVAVPACARSSPAGLWDAVVVGGVEIPFRFEISGDGAQLAGAFFDGETRVESTAGRFDEGAVILEFAQYGTRLGATLTGSGLDGYYDRGTRGTGYPFRAVRAVPPPADAAAPSIAGAWTIPVESSKGEHAWRFLARQDGANVTATVLRIDGDTGTLTGRYRDGRFVLSHFSGARPMLLEVTLSGDGSLEMLENGKTRRTALRDGDSRAPAVAVPSDPTAHTRAKNLSAPLDLAFPDLAGRLVSLSDAKFRGKVLVISITGSWCPNCHDEAPFLVELYRKYHAQGLEVVALSFEEAAQLKKPDRLRAFMKRYGIDYTVLVAGEPDELTTKVPQFENLNSFPTTLYLGRDGRVRSTHAGFPSAASGEFHIRAKEAITREVEQLLAEPLS